MRSSYPLSSMELSDKTLIMYENLIYLLGYESSQINRSGLYDRIDVSGNAYFLSASGIPHIGTIDGKNSLGLSYMNSSEVVREQLKFDYIYKRSLDVQR